MFACSIDSTAAGRWYEALLGVSYPSTDRAFGVHIFAFSAQAVTLYSENFAGEFKIVGPFGDDPNTYVPIGFS